ncbi:LUD domain-containing protein [Natrinema salifodinae]|uniref:L-lactate dehydrogenase complex protein LldG n=1 Tax=Natrinema salifodinae TaxID=1202768 RepID=A0A1I0QSZ8_9EURY|nr:LUD domain-containing protein [Natrinema salifodinae]SEW30687.1 L-lactate dehydrogenase complex protein LldG [Natrinema salifodinae]
MATRLESFETAVRETTASTIRATPETVEEALSDAIAEPAVGAPLPFDDVAIDDASVPITVDPTREELLAAETGVTGAVLGIASYGSVVLRSTTDVDELAALFPDRHVVLVRERDVVDDMATAFDELAPIFEEEAADAIIATGPSATADMGALVYGAHGPREVHVIVIDESESSASTSGGGR